MMGPMTEAAQAVQISTSDFATKVAPDLWVGVGGVPMLARCPKDAVWNALAKQEQDSDGGMDVGEEQLRTLAVAVFGRENGAQALEMLDDPSDHDVTLESLGGLLGYCMEKWGPDVVEHFEQLQASQGNRSQRRVVAKKAAGGSSRKPSAPKAAAKKAAAKKTTAKKTAARKGR